MKTVIPYPMLRMSPMMVSQCFVHCQTPNAGLTCLCPLCSCRYFQLFWLWPTTPCSYSVGDFFCFCLFVFVCLFCICASIKDWIHKTFQFHRFEILTCMPLSDRLALLVVLQLQSTSLLEYSLSGFLLAYCPGLAVFFCLFFLFFSTILLSESTKGVPEFWLTVLRNVGVVAPLIEVGTVTVLLCVICDVCPCFGCVDAWVLLCLWSFVIALVVCLWCLLLFLFACIRRRMLHYSVIWLI